MIRALLFPLGAVGVPPVAVAILDGGRTSVECDDPDLKLRLSTVLSLPADATRTLEELDDPVAPGSEEHFRAALNQAGHLGLRVVFEDG